MSDRGQFEIVLVGADEAHRYVRDFDTLGAAEASCAERNARAVEMGIEARYSVLDTKA